MTWNFPNKIKGNTLSFKGNFVYRTKFHKKIKGNFAYRNFPYSSNIALQKKTPIPLQEKPPQTKHQKASPKGTRFKNIRMFAFIVYQLRYRAKLAIIPLIVPSLLPSLAYRPVHQIFQRLKNQLHLQIEPLSPQKHLLQFSRQMHR